MDHTGASHVLIIDDDAELCGLLTHFLAGEGFEIETMRTGEQAVGRVLSGAYAIVVLDVMMPGMNGFEVLRRIRAESRTPILMLTARGDAHDRILGLEMGADDYLPKPFDPQELAARLRAILRRVAPKPAGSPAPPLRIGDVLLDPGRRTMRRADREVDLTTVEYDLLEHLMRAAGQVVSREDLARGILGRELSPFDRSIDTHVCNLRRKLGMYPDGSERIKGVRGVGYMYAAPR